MFGNNGGSNGAASRSVTILSPRVRVNGDIAFSGYLRVQGSVVGDVTCTSKSQGITVVHGPGSVVGSIKSPNIVIAGRVEGALEAGELMEIHKGATIIGDARYKRIAVERGAIVEGVLAATAPAAERRRPERRIAVSESLAGKHIDVALPDNRRATDKFRVSRRYRIAAAIAVIVVGMLLWLRQPSGGDNPEMVAAADVPAAEPASAVAVSEEKAPVVAEAAPSPARQAAKPPVPETKPEASVATPPTPAAVPAVVSAARVANPDKVLTVQGLTPGKPTDVFFVSAKEPCVLYRKARDSAGDGTRIELRKGDKRRFPIAANEVVRVAEGSDLEMFYQGRKIPSQTVVSGNWMAFEPLPDE